MIARLVPLLAALLLTCPAWADPPQMCEFQKRAADFSIHHIRRGLAEADFWRVHPLPDNWSEEIKGITRTIVEAAYRWHRGEQDFIDQTVRDCK